jgi:hypothetical protein
MMRIMWPATLYCPKWGANEICYNMNSQNILLKLRWQNTDDFTAIANKWREDASTVLSSFIWEAYELLKSEVLDQIDSSQIEVELERSITQLLEPRIQKVMTGFEPFYVQHGAYEYETRKAPPAQSPQYDIAFVLRCNPNIMWPCEAKVLYTDGSVAEYINDIKAEFLTCRYAPFSSEGAMLGYLFSGSPERVFENLEKKIPCKLLPLIPTSDRPQRYSDHIRQVKIGKSYPVHFRCQHLILQIVNERRN